jgi:hypothetical protein
VIFGRSSFRVLAPAFGLALLAACSKSTSSPSSQAVTDFTTGVQATDGTAAVLTSHASPPAANGGPVHSGSSLTTQDAPVAPQPLTPDVLRKLALSHATIH